MICKRCGSKNRDTREICFHCGNPLAEAGDVWIDELPNAERSHSFHERLGQAMTPVRKPSSLTVDDEDEDLLKDKEAALSPETYEEEEESGVVIRAQKSSFRQFYEKAFVPDDEKEEVEEAAYRKTFRERYNALFEPDDEEEDAPKSIRKKIRPSEADEAYDPETNAFVVEAPEDSEDEQEEVTPAASVAFVSVPLEQDEPETEKEAEIPEEIVFKETPANEEEEMPEDIVFENQPEENETDEMPEEEMPEEIEAEEEPEEVPEEDQYDTEDRAFDKQIKEESRRKAAEALTNADESISEIAVDEDARELVFQSSHTTRKKRSVGMTVAIWLLVLLFILIGITLGVLYYRSTHPAEQPPIIDPNKGAVEKLNLNDPISKKMTDSTGREYIHTVFYGEPGDRIYLSCNNSYRTFTETSMEIDLYLEDLFDPEYEFLEKAVNANPNAYHVRDGKKYAYNTPSFSLSVPESQLELLSPTKQSMKVYQDRYTIELWTSTNAKVTLNNNNITSYLDGSGIISYPVDVPEQSSTTYQLSVTQPYHTSRSEVFIISRDALAVNLTIATSSATIIHEPYIDISGSTEAGASISTNLPTMDFSHNDVYNTYNMRVNLSGVTYGKVEVIVTADAGDGRVSSRSHSFWYWPEETQTTTTAYKFDSAVATNPSGYRNQTFKLTKARVTKILSANKFEAAVTYNNVDYSLIITNENRLVNSSVAVGSTYNIFAQCQGSQENGIPVFRAWYVYTA